VKTFSDAERALMCAKVSDPFTLLGNLDSGPPARYHLPAAVLLVTLANWFTKDEERHLGRRLMAKAEICTDTEMPILDWHFMLSEMIVFYYRCRNDGPEFLPLVEARCRDMIDISADAAAAMLAEYPKSPLPQHRGYSRLSWLLKKTDPAESSRLRAEGEAQGWIVSI
jgi:hypothetical protein